MKKYSALLVIREMQSRPKVRPFPVIEMTKIKKSDSTKYWRECGSIKSLC